MAWPGTLASVTGGALVTTTQLNNWVDAMNYLGNTHDHNGDSGDGADLTSLYVPFASIGYSILENYADSTYRSHGTITLDAAKLNADGKTAIIIIDHLYEENGATSGTNTAQLILGSTTLYTFNVYASGGPTIRYNRIMVTITALTSSSQMVTIHHVYDEDTGSPTLAFVDCQFTSESFASDVTLDWQTKAAGAAQDHELQHMSVLYVTE